jgi:probable HAF family extracellular repeat protein
MVKARRAFGRTSFTLLIVSIAIGLAGGTVTRASTQIPSITRATISLAKAKATPTATPAGTAAYSVTDLGTLGGSVNDTTQAYGINGNGQIVGKSVVQQNGTYTYHAFIYSGGDMADLGTLPGGDESEAHAIDKYGDVAGFANTCKGCYTENAFLYQNGKLKDLGTLGGGCSFAYGMNDFAEVVGQACASNQVAFLFSGGKMTDLGTLGGCCSGANAINNSHQVVGWSETSTTFSSTSHAVLWSNGTMTDLTARGFPASSASAINNAGQVVGGAYLWSNGTATNLGSLAGGDTEAQAINDLGQVVGQSYLPTNGSYHAFLYSGGQLRDLNNLIPTGTGWTLSEATGINGARQIVCNGYNADGYANAFLLSPI